MNNASMQVIQLKNQGQAMPLCSLLIPYINIVLVLNYILKQAYFKITICFIIYYL